MPLHYCSYCARPYAPASRVCICEANRGRPKSYPKPLSYARLCFHIQRCNAERRNHEWLLTFEQWWAVWEASDHWHERGRRPDQYCMARDGDEGPYAMDNVSIITNRENRKRQKMVRSEAFKQEQSVRMTAWHKSRKL